MFHTLILVGNLGRDPEMRYTPSGTAVCNFSVATNRTYNNQAGEQVKETTWWRISTWGKMAENCNQFLHRGNKVLVEGRLLSDPKTGGPRVYNRSDGTPGASFEVHADTVRFLSSRGEQGDDEVASEPQSGEAPANNEIPF